MISIRVVVLSVILAVLLCGCVHIAKDKWFRTDEAFEILADEYRVGAPRAVAYTSVVERELWDLRSFRIYIPLALKRHKSVWRDFNAIEAAIAEGLVQVDSLKLVYMTTGDSIALNMLVDCDSSGQQCTPELYAPQGLFDQDWLCLMADTVMIPDEEDSISVSFRTSIRNKQAGEVSQKHFAFILRRDEHKKLFIDVGR